MPSPFITQVSRGTPFDPSTHNFDPTNAQDAIDYVFNIFQNIMREPTGFVNKNIDSTISFVNGTRTLSIAPKTPTYSQYQYCINGKIYTETTTKSIIIPDLEGTHHIWFDSNQVLQTSQTEWSIESDIVFITSIYWDATNNLALRIEEERHGVILDRDTHKYLHIVNGTKIPLYGDNFAIGNYIDDGDGSLNSHAQYSISNGTVIDEDLFLNVVNSASPSANFEQILSTIAYLPVFYLLGAGDWRAKTANSFAIYENSPNTCYYNQYNAGSWSLANCTNGYYFVTWIMLTSSIVEPIMVILGQREDPDLISAINNNTKASLIVPGDLNEEFYYLKKMVWQTSTTYTNTPKARLVYIATSTEINPANDRFQVLASYNGNAGSGKYLEFFPGQSSDSSPFPIPEVSYLRTLILSSSSNSTGTISLYNNNDLVNPIANISLTNNRYARIDFALLIPQDTQLTAKVSSGSISKPGMVLWIQTSL